MPHLDRIRPLASPRGSRALGAQTDGEWRVDASWVEHRCAAETRRLPLDVVLCAIDRATVGGALRRDGTLLAERIRGVRAHHPLHGRYHVELRSSRWEIVWYGGAGGGARRLSLQGAVEHVTLRQWQREAA